MPLPCHTRPRSRYFVPQVDPLGSFCVAGGVVMQADIKGTTMPILETKLDPGDVLVSTHGELAWMTPSIQMSQTTSTGGGAGGFMQGLKRVVGGGGLFLT